MLITVYILISRCYSILKPFMHIWIWNMCFLPVLAWIWGSEMQARLCRVSSRVQFDSAFERGQNDEWFYRRRKLPKQGHVLLNGIIHTLFQRLARSLTRRFTSPSSTWRTSRSVQIGLIAILLMSNLEETSSPVIIFDPGGWQKSCDLLSK